MSNRQQNKLTIECGLGENCPRRNCTFKHPESRNIEVNRRKVSEEKRQNRVRLEQQQMEMIERHCRNWDACLQHSCPYRHSPKWDPVQNQRLAEEKRRQNEQRKQQERQHALNICNQEASDNRTEPNQYQKIKNSMAKNLIGDEYQYDDEYLDIHEKIWQKQSERQTNKW